MYRGWLDPDPNRPAIDKYNDAVAAYRRTYPNRPPEVVLTSIIDAAELQADGTTTIPVEARVFIPRHLYYVGVHDTQEETEWAR